MSLEQQQPVVLYFSRMKATTLAADIEEAIHSVKYGTVRNVIIEPFRMDYNHKMFMRGAAIVDNWNYTDSECNKFITQLSKGDKSAQMFFKSANIWCKVTLFRLESGTKLCKQILSIINTVVLVPEEATSTPATTTPIQEPVIVAPTLSALPTAVSIGQTKRKIVTTTNRGSYYSPNKHQTCVAPIAPALGPPPVQTEYDSEDELLNDVFYTVQSHNACYNALPIASALDEEPQLPPTPPPPSPPTGYDSEDDEFLPPSVQTEYDSDDDLLNEVLDTVQSPTAYQ